MVAIAAAIVVLSPYPSIRASSAGVHGGHRAAISATGAFAAAPGASSGDTARLAATPASGADPTVEGGSSREWRLPYLHETITVTADGRAVVTNPAAREVVVNKERALPEGYVPADLVYPAVPFSFKEKIEKRMLRREAAAELERLFAAAADAGIRLVGISGYRSYATQRAIFARQVRSKGAKEAARVSAYPGRSEHQTGWAIDVSSASVNYALEARFGSSREGRWLARNAPNFGFIVRYPEGMEERTGYIYEPWHIRYVGKELALEIAARGITLEDLFASPARAE